MTEYLSPRAQITAARNDLNDALTAYLDLIRPATLSALGPQGALNEARDFEKIRNRMTTADHAHLTALEDTHAAAVFARPSTATLLALTLRITPGEARARVNAARSLAPRVTLTGAPLGLLRRFRTVGPH